MLKTHGTDASGIDIEVIKTSSLGIEGWALHNFGDEKDDNTSSIFPEHNSVEPLIKYPSALLEGSGLAPLVTDGHKAGDGHGIDIHTEHIAHLDPPAGRWENGAVPKSQSPAPVGRS